MTHWVTAAFAVLFVIDALIGVTYGVALRGLGISLPVSVAPALLRLLAWAPLFSKRRHFESWLSIVGLALYLGLLYWYGDGGQGKKLWGKIKSQVLTAVNAASLQRQVKESC